MPLARGSDCLSSIRTMSEAMKFRMKPAAPPATAATASATGTASLVAFHCLDANTGGQLLCRIKFDLTATRNVNQEPKRLSNNETIHLK